MVETKSKILHAAIELLAKNPNTSIDEIAKHIGISRRTLHRHYDGRQDLVRSVLDHVVKDYLKQVEKLLRNPKYDEKQRLKIVFLNDIKNAKNYMLLGKIQETEIPNFLKNNPAYDNLHNLYQTFFKELIQKGLIKPSFSVLWIELFYSSIIQATIKRSDSGGADSRFIEMAWDSFWNGIKN